LKRENNNLHCQGDIVVEDDENIVEVDVKIDEERVKNKEGYVL
jgi:hypothetical protein